ncbi:MAG: type II toxin-antitoxin system RelE/ParE family toxin [Candidatus Diapherotrites archaeon]|uniref:Type II toxin-antitoxin system RelE/ParE family toxin n=1 Tax=Candidatus Iainarchaeum sp. TaxID=3101447 RepID=A0A938YXL7_9ARCH|nr:type II toxin-antitoxin system RelE/ParE family toxin [Candidatus Diapherotrites archaeon]
MYEVIFSNKAEMQLKRLEKPVQGRIISALERARIRPEDHFKKLVGEDAFSLRVGHYRVIADIERKKLLILVLKVGHRRNVYK